MLTVNYMNNQNKINFTASKKSIGEKMIDSYNKTEDPLREKLIEKNKNCFWHEARGWALLITMAIATMTIAVIAGISIGCNHKYNSKVNRKVEVRETEVLQAREKELDEKYNAGTLLFEEYVNGLNQIKSDYETLEAQTAQKLDNVVQSRIEHSDLKSAYEVNPSTGRYDYDLTADNKTKSVKINVLDNSQKSNDTISDDRQKWIQKCLLY